MRRYPTCTETDCAVYAVWQERDAAKRAELDAQRARLKEGVRQAIRGARVRESGKRQGVLL